MRTSESLLIELVNSYENVGEDSNFMGFSSNSITFFDDYPEDSRKATEWWNSKGGNRPEGDYQQHLKPEFYSLVDCMIQILHPRFDRGIQTDTKQCIGNPNSQTEKWRYWPYYWSALHYAKSETSNKSVEIQFFMNLTNSGLRVGIYFGKHQSDSGQWNGNIKRFSENQDDIFSEVIRLITDKAYMLVKTTSSDHATGNVGTIFHPQNAKELYALVVGQSQFTLVRTIPKTRLQSRDVVVDILEIFSETRTLYEALESRKKINQRRLLT